MIPKDYLRFFYLLPEIAAAVVISYFSLRWCLIYSTILILYRIHILHTTMERQIRMRWFVTFNALEVMAKKLECTTEDSKAKQDELKKQLGQEKWDEVMREHNAVFFD